MQPAGVIVLPGGHAGFAAGFAGGGGGGLTAAAAAGGLGCTACGGGVTPRGLASVLGGVSPFRVAWSFSAGPFFSCTAVPGVTPVGVPGAIPVGLVPGAIPVGFVAIGAAPVGFAVGFASLAATTPLPEKTPGLAVAAIAGWPWFAEERSALLVLAICTCWIWAGVAAMCRSCAAASCWGVGCAVVPPEPPLKLTRVAPG